MKKYTEKNRKAGYGRAVLWCAAAVLICAVVKCGSSLLFSAEGSRYHEAMQKLAGFLNIRSSDSVLEELEELLENNEEAADFVACYSERDRYKGQIIDLSDELESGTVPLLMQWDKRWGYDPYGDSIVGLSGCGPTCLAMAYLYFTEDVAMNPGKMAEFASDNGFCTAEGTSWSLWTEGAKKLGLRGEELPLDENRMKRALDDGGLIVCSMRPGDFTTSGHFILLRDWDEKGFWVNDPNRRTNSEMQWSYETLKGQIKNLWSLTEGSQ